MQVWCNKCGSDVEGAHHGSCPDHPNNIALRERAQNGGKATRPQVEQDPATAALQAPKSDWFAAETTMTFSADQLKKVFEHFLQNVLDLDVSVVDIKASTKKGATVVFKGKGKDEVLGD